MGQLPRITSFIGVFQMKLAAMKLHTEKAPRSRLHGIKLAALALCPIGKTIVPAPVAQAAEEAATLRDYHGRR